MSAENPVFQIPPTTQKEDGSTRRVGFELEFSGISLEDASRAVEQSLHGKRTHETSAAHKIEAPGIGEFTVEIDWSFLKRKAEDVAKGEPGADWVEPLSRAAPLLVPIEVVCPPVDIDRLTCLTPMITALRDSGAIGTEESLIAAYGVHINPESPALDAPTLYRYLKAFALLQWWLVDAHDVDPMRRLTPYIDPYPEAYMKAVLAEESPSRDSLFEDYLKHNATRNRALDLLPLLAEIDEPRLRKTIDDDRVNARPTFHYRLPNCHIEREDWALADSWNTWCVIEQLAEDEDGLTTLARDFLEADRPVVGMNRSAWVQTVDEWLRDHALV